MTTGSDPALPVFTSLGATVDPDTFAVGSSAGMTKREMMAAMAMQGLLSRGGISLDNAASDSVKYADMLIAELSQ